jgi:ABC-type lipopolysaccharide export system ATPase subunit
MSVCAAGTQIRRF